MGKSRFHKKFQVWNVLRPVLGTLSFCFFTILCQNSWISIIFYVRFHIWYHIWRILQYIYIYIYILYIMGNQVFTQFISVSSSSWKWLLVNSDMHCNPTAIGRSQTMSDGASLCLLCSLATCLYVRRSFLAEPKSQYPLRTSCIITSSVRASLSYATRAPDWIK